MSDSPLSASPAEDAGPTCAWCGISLVGSPQIAVPGTNAVACSETHAACASRRPASGPTPTPTGRAFATSDAPDEVTALRSAMAGFTQHDVDVLTSLVPVVEHYDRHGDGNRDPVLISLAERIATLLRLSVAAHHFVPPSSSLPRSPVEAGAPGSEQEQRHEEKTEKGQLESRASRDATWGELAASVFPNSRSMTREERAAFDAAAYGNAEPITIGAGAPEEATPICATCPVCNGAGQQSRPPFVAGDATTWMDAGVRSYPCPACSSTGVVWRPERAPVLAVDFSRSTTQDVAVEALTQQLRARVSQLEATVAEVEAAYADLARESSGKVNAQATAFLAMHDRDVATWRALRDAVSEYDYLRRECPDEAERDAGWVLVMTAMGYDMATPEHPEADAVDRSRSYPHAVEALTPSARLAPEGQ